MIGAICGIGGIAGGWNNSKQYYNSLIHGLFCLCIEFRVVNNVSIVQCVFKILETSMHILI
jgi:hypothetical protein